MIKSHLHLHLQPPSSQASPDLPSLSRFIRCGFSSIYYIYCISLVCLPTAPALLLLRISRLQVKPAETPLVSRTLSLSLSAPGGPLPSPWLFQMTIAITNRSLRTIRTVRSASYPTSVVVARVARPTDSSVRTNRTSQELEFLTDAAVITSAQLSAILEQLPSQTKLHAPISSETPFSPPTSQVSSLSLNEKCSLATQHSSPPPPPSYSAGPPVLSLASALYAYTPTDAGDLALQPNDHVQVLEHMNTDCTRLS
jgi:hypothetical protein